MRNEFVVAGSGYRNRQQLAIVAKQCLRGAPVRLVREPTNEFDPNAIQVWVDAPTGRLERDRPVMLGYVPRGFATKLAPKLDRNRTVDDERVRAVYVEALVDPSEDFDPIRFSVEVFA